MHTLTYLQLQNGYTFKNLDNQSNECDNFKNIVVHHESGFSKEHLEKTDLPHWGMEVDKMEWLNHWSFFSYLSHWPYSHYYSTLFDEIFNQKNVKFVFHLKT